VNPVCAFGEDMMKSVIRVSDRTRVVDDKTRAIIYNYHAPFGIPAVTAHGAGETHSRTLYQAILRYKY
jgi:hypothetical protein